MSQQQIQMEPMPRIPTDRGVVESIESALQESPCDPTRWILSLLIHGRVSAWDQDSLAGLAPAGQEVFLMKDDDFFYPSGQELFPIDLIQGTALLSGEAIFKQKFRSEESTGFGSEYEIRSTVISRDSDGATTFGFLGLPCRSESEHMDQLFAREARQLRSAFVTARSLQTVVDSALSEDQAAVVVGGDDGRIVAANEAAARLLGSETSRLAGAPFADFEARLSRTLPDHRLVMRSLKSDAVRLSSVTLTPVRKPELDSPFVTDFFVQRLRQKVANVIAAGSLLDPEAGTESVEDQRSLVHSVISESESLEQLLAKMHLLLDFDRLTEDQVSLCTAFDQIHDSQNYGAALQIESDCDICLEQPRSAVLALSEAVLKAHLGDSESQRHTRVQIKGNDTGKRLTVTVTTIDSTPGVVGLDNCWDGFAARLAHRMGADYVSQTDTGAMSVETRIIFHTLQE